jgi:hypothetical protein
MRKIHSSWAFVVEPPIGIEPMTYALRGGLQASSAVHRVTPVLLTGLLGPSVSTVVQGCR